MDLSEFLAVKSLDFKPAFKHHFAYPNPDSSEGALSLALLAKMNNQRLFVVACDSQEMLGRLYDELVFFGVTPFVFADWEILPYDRLSPSEERVAERIHLLSEMPNAGILLVAVQTAIQRVAPPSWLLGQHFEVVVGGIFDREKQRQRLTQAGYRLVDTVYSSGEFALRGSVVDIFVVGQALPVRLELFDDEIESIRFFDPDSQRTFNEQTLKTYLKNTSSNLTLPTSASLERFGVLPAREFDLEGAKEIFRHNFAEAFPHLSARKIPIYNEVINGIASNGIENYQPLFFESKVWQTGVLFAYLPKEAVLVYDKNIEKQIEHFFAEVESRYANFGSDNERPILAPHYLYLPKSEFFANIKPFAQVVFGEGTSFFTKPSAPVATVGIDHRADEPLHRLVTLCQANLDKKILITTESAGRREVLIELLKGALKPTLVTNFEDFLTCQESLCLGVAPIERGLSLGDLLIITESQIFGRQVVQARQKKPSKIADSFLVKSVSELSVGNLVVHMTHGIGRYLGLVVMDVGAGEEEFIHLEYADDANIYVPMSNLAVIGRYSGVDSEVVALSKLGSGKWDKARQKALEEIYDVAAELLNVQARRKAKDGIAFHIDMTAYELFASGFAYEETPDQQAAILAVMEDMRQNKPMDRLICGDVGFGKTEVAMRAAFIAVQAGYQVAVLVPTTLLASQHEDNFKTRFADWPIRVESLSRFVGKKAQDQVLDDLAQGKVDIVIGTHKLLQEDVCFKNLGLMIVDEEHRFGVRHKERIKAMQSNIDSLFMTATPIPRTLNMALSGMQDISIIATPPARRLAIKTFVVEKNNQTTSDAILRELLRGGQVYYLHNDVASIEVAAESLSVLLPEVRVGVAHGQMSEKELSAVMSDFYHKKTNVLVASTIIETGIDIPNANTIIINRADKFGLAQLHQLRGRVGRSHHQAYCYLFVPSLKGLTADAQKRLDAVVRANELGAGFILASEDLEIRGAGEILGKEQSGHMQSIGFGLYMEMLNRATRAIKEGKVPKLESPLELISEINLHTSALIPEDYLGDVSERLLFYKRIAAAESYDELNDIRSEMVDRFGVMPVVSANLFAMHRLRILAKPLGISKIDVNHHSLSLEFSFDTPIDGGVIVALLQSDAGYRMRGATTLKYQFKQPKETLNERVDAAMNLLNYLGQTLSA